MSFSKYREKILKIIKENEKAINSSLIFLIVLLALILRVYNLSSLPSGFHNDEASFLFNAQTLLETGKDEDGRSYPLFLNSFMDPKPALYSYLQIPFISLLESSIFASRLPSVLLGVISIFFSYLLIKQLLDRKYALLLSLLLAISPWHIMASRSTQEVIMSFCFSVITIYLLILLIKKNSLNILYLLLISLFAFLAMYSYHSAKIFLPALSIIILFILGRTKNTVLNLSIIGIFIFTFLISLQLGGTDRFNAVSIFTDPEVQLIINEQIVKATPEIPLVAIRFFYNKITSYSMAIMDQYFQYFQGSFLFIKGGEPDRYTIPYHGLFFHIEAILVLIGFIASFMKKKLRTSLYIFLSWMMIAPLPAALSVQESPSTIRSFPLVIPLLFFISVGIFTLIESTKRNIRLFGVPLIILGYSWGIVYFANQFIVQQPIYKPWSRHYADQEMAKAVKELEGQYKNIVITKQGDPYIYLALEGLLPIDQIQRSYPLRKENTSKFGKYTFDIEHCPMTTDATDTLYVVDMICKTQIENYNVISEITYKDDAVRYFIVAPKKTPNPPSN